MTSELSTPEGRSETANEAEASKPPPAAVTIVDLDKALPVTPGRRLGELPAIGVATRSLTGEASTVADGLLLTLVPPGIDDRRCVEVEDPIEEANALAAQAARTPQAIAVLDGLLRLTDQLDVRDGLVAESLAYSVLLASTEFAQWRQSKPRRDVQTCPEPLLLQRVGDVVDVRLNRPDRRNAFNRGMVQALLDALDLVALDASIARLRISGEGSNFSSGGDLDEFGSVTDPAGGHGIRLAQSVGWAVHQVADRVEVTVHGASFGMGVEVPAFAGRVIAHENASFVLPELAMGLIPGAGGTVSITRRIGRWRTAWMAMSGRTVSVERALVWGLVDGRA